MQNNLVEVQPTFRENLKNGVIQFDADTKQFYADFDKDGPLAEGITPAEASDRVTVYQSRFDEL